MRITVEILPLADGQLEVTITRAYDDPAVMIKVEAVLREIMRSGLLATMKASQTETVIIALQPPADRRGGPAGTPEDEKMRVVRGWLEVRGRMNQEVYAQNKGVASSTLRRWMHELRKGGKL